LSMRRNDGYIVTKNKSINCHSALDAESYKKQFVIDSCWSLPLWIPAGVYPFGFLLSQE
jgi:hypothetical protein